MRVRCDGGPAVHARADVPTVRVFIKDFYYKQSSVECVRVCCDGGPAVHARADVPTVRVFIKDYLITSKAALGVCMSALTEGRLSNSDASSVSVDIKGCFITSKAALGVCVSAQNAGCLTQMLPQYVYASRTVYLQAKQWRWGYACLP